MSAPLPHEYRLSLSWRGGAKGVASAPPRPELDVGPPPEWDGDERSWSPEHLLLAAAASCLMTTFAAVAAKSRLELRGFECGARGVLDKSPAGIVFTSIALKVALRVPPGERERGARLLELAEKRCIVSNSLRVPVALEREVAEG